MCKTGVERMTSDRCNLRYTETLAINPQRGNDDASAVGTQHMNDVTAVIQSRHLSVGLEIEAKIIMLHLPKVIEMGIVPANSTMLARGQEERRMTTATMEIKEKNRKPK